jgi:hypothetical protein
MLREALAEIPAAEEMLIIVPLRRARMLGSRRRVMAIGAKKLVSNWERASSLL